MAVSKTCAEPELTVEGYRLSPNQKWVWQQDPGSRLEVVISIEGPLDEAVLKQALGRVIDRHEILRTRFQRLPTMVLPIQVIEDAFSPESIAPPCPADVFEDPAELAEWVSAQNRDERPVFCIARRSATSHWLAMSFPAACGDSASGWVLFHDLVSAIAEWPETKSLEARVLAYLEFSEWRHQVAESEDAAEGVLYWRTALADLPRHSLVSESKLPAFQKSGFARLAVPLDPDTVAALERHAQDAGQQLPVVLLAAWQVLLSRFCESEECMVEVLFDGRKFSELEGAPGVFAEFVPVMGRCGQEMAFSRLLSQLSEQLENDSGWLEYLTLAFKDGDVPRSDFGFAFEEGHGPRTVGGTRFRLSLCRNTAFEGRQALHLAARKDPDSLRIELAYARQRYEPEAMSGLAGSLASLLSCLGKGFERPLFALDLLDEESRYRQVVAWNRTESGFPVKDNLYSAFAAAVAAHPNRTALVCEDRELSFQALKKLSARLAFRLREHGVGTETPVILLVERSSRTFAALWAVLQAGGFFVPIDPGQPQARLAAMIDQVDAPVILAHRKDLRHLAASRAEVICLDDPEVWPGPELGNHAPPLPAQAAYCIFTSGSTGQPKGVLVTQRALINLGHALDRTVFQEGLARRVGLNAPLFFDASIKMWLRQSAGSTLLPIPEEARRDGEALLSFVVQHGIDTLDCTPTHLKLLLSAGLTDRGDLPLKTLLIGGESLASHAWRLLAAQSSMRFFNVYGPTETTVDATVFRIRGEEPVLGRPLPNTRLYLMDALARPVPIGLRGELYIGGPGVARGYLNQPAKTARSFVPDPFGGEAGARCYRSGDMARYRNLPDLAEEDWVENGGYLAFSGRSDYQVKIRGYRVELSEIKTAIESHPGVQQAEVIFNQDDEGPCLIGYAVPVDLAEEDRLHRLPNGLQVDGQNPFETTYLYQELFEKKAYLQHEIRYHDGMCIFDVGANIGLFTLFAKQECAAPRIFAFEPLGPIFQSLEKNMARYAPEVSIFDYGLSDRARTETFTYYTGYSMMSGSSAYADAEGEKEVIKRFLANSRQQGSKDSGVLLEHADQLLSERFLSNEIACRLRRLSEVIRERGVDRIDLLKIDVQRAESDVLAGIDADDWPKIRQVVMEVHDAPDGPSAGRTRELASMLRGLGFEVRVEQDDLLRGTDRHNLYAWRPEHIREVAGKPVTGTATWTATREPVTAELLESYLADLLPEVMRPQAMVLLERMPLNRRGKIDREALPVPSAGVRRKGSIAPRNEREQKLANIWSAVTGTKNVGVNDNFFAIGGDSIRTIQIQGLAEKQGLFFTLQDMFNHPTIEQLLAAIDRGDPTGSAADLVQPFELVSDQVRLALPQEVVDAYPLSKLQEGMVYHTRFRQDPRVYHNTRALRIKAPFHADALRNALEDVAGRHPILRTSFRFAPIPLQLVHDRVSLDFAIEDIAHLTPDRRLKWLDELFEEELNRPYEWSRPGLFRSSAVRLSESEFVLHFADYHGILDGWSLQLLFNEWLDGYVDKIGWRKVQPSPPPKCGFRDAIAAEMRACSDEKSLAFWSARLRGFRPSPILRAAAAPFGKRAMDTETFLIDAAMCLRLRQLAEASATSLKSVLMAAHLRVLSLITGRLDPVTGTVTSIRPEIPDGERILGLFLNTLPLRLDLGLCSTWFELIEAVFAEEYAMVPHRFVPLPQLQRLAGGQSLFEHFFNFAQFHDRSDEARYGGLKAEIVDSTTIDIDVTLSMDFEVSANHERILLSLIYDTSALSREQIIAVGESLQAVLASMTRDPDGAWSEVPLPAEAVWSQAAPAPVRAIPAGNPRNPREPSGEAEREIAGLWAEVLGMDPERVFMNLGFGDQGGDSLAAFRLVTGIEERFHTRLPLCALDRNATPEDLLARIDVGSSAKGSRP